jgi:hypothetical protein
MFKDFENTKKQLSELADIVNKFKSESVQLKLLELLFDKKPHALDETEKEKPKFTPTAKRMGMSTEN